MIRCFSLPGAELASVQDRLYFLGFDHTPERLAAGEAAIQAARRLNPDAGETHLAVAQHRYRGYRDDDGARAEIGSLNAPFLTIRCHSSCSVLSTAVKVAGTNSSESDRAIELDPRNFYTLQQMALGYQSTCGATPISAGLGSRSDDCSEQRRHQGRARFVELNWHADTRPLHNMIETVLADTLAPSLADTWLTLALCERDFPAASRAVAALGNNTISSDAILLSPAFVEALVARVQGDTTAAKTFFEKARAEQEEKVRAQPDYAPAICVLGLIDAGLGRKEDALREGKRAMELLPISKDSVNGAHMIEYLQLRRPGPVKKILPSSK